MMRFREDAIETLVWTDGEARDIHIWRGVEVEVVFLAVHGGMSHGGDWFEFAKYFRNHNFATVALDLCGHNHQKRAHIPRFEVFLDDLRLFIEWAKKKYPETPLVLVGHSMGALIVTHYGLRRMIRPEPQVIGFVLSSPYFVNAVKVPSYLLPLSSLLSAVAPGMKLPLEDFLHQLTHDEQIERRLLQDAADDLRATEVTMRFGRELLVAQEYIPENIERWSFPLLVFIAGQDKLANSVESERLLATLPAELVTKIICPNNYHENFNELNREDLFKITFEWVLEQMESTRMKLSRTR